MKKHFYNEMLPKIKLTAEVEVLTSSFARSIKGGTGGCSGGSALACGCYQATLKASK